MKIKLSPSKVLVSLAMVSAFLGSGVSLGTVFGFAILPVRIMGVLCALWIAFYGVKYLENRLKIQYIILTFFYMMVSTLLFSENYSRSLPMLFDCLSLFSIICVVILNVENEYDYKRFTNLYLICTLITIGICIYEYLTQIHIAVNYTQAFSQSEWAYSYLIQAPTAFLYNPNNVAVLMIISIPIFLEKFEGQSSIKQKLVWLAGVLLDFITIFMTGSRGGLVVGAIIIALFFISSSVTLWKKLFLLIMGFGIIIFFSDFIFKQLGYGGMISDEKINIFAEGDGGRLSLAVDSLENIFVHNPIFGLGAGSVENKGLMSSHNTVIEVLCNYGVLGFIMFVFIIIRLLRMIWAQSNRTVSVLLFIAFFMSMFIPPSIMTLYFLFIPVSLKVGKYYYERGKFNECINNNK